MTVSKVVMYPNRMDKVVVGTLKEGDAIIRSWEKQLEKGEVMKLNFQLHWDTGELYMGQFLLKNVKWGMDTLLQDLFGEDPLLEDMYE